MKPIIGITTSGNSDYQISSTYYSGYYVAPDAYVKAVRRAGGIPILLPPGEENISEILDTVSGIIVSGGGDIHPSQYGGNSEHTSLNRLDPERDESEISIIQEMAERKDKPVLCVCRGMQVMNVALGGTMVEHIPDIRETDTHRNQEGFWIIHDVAVNDSSKMAKAMQSTSVSTFSGHHQALKDIANGLDVVAMSPDGIVEGIELSTHPWMVGVQWHPEKSAHEDVTQQRLFDQLVTLAKSGLNA
ncbi:MAG: gamma-glutamyl-gamma-aminobutyrate hydrolase family protein [Phototrophicaceae bacterium]